MGLFNRTAKRRATKPPRFGEWGNLSDDWRDVRVIPDVDRNSGHPTEPHAVGRVREVFGLRYGPADLSGTPSKPVAWVTIQEPGGRRVSGRISMSALLTIADVLRTQFQKAPR